MYARPSCLRVLAVSIHSVMSEMKFFLDAFRSEIIAFCFTTIDLALATQMNVLRHPSLWLEADLLTGSSIITESLQVGNMASYGWVSRPSKSFWHHRWLVRFHGESTCFASLWSRQISNPNALPNCRSRVMVAVTAEYSSIFIQHEKSEQRLDVDFSQV